MELPVLDKFCFIFDLRTGCLAMGAINAVSTNYLIMLIHPKNVSLEAKNNLSDISINNFKNILIFIIASTFYINEIYHSYSSSILLQRIRAVMEFCNRKRNFWISEIRMYS